MAQPTNPTNVDLLVKDLSPDDTFPISFVELERAAASVLPKNQYGYVRSGAGGEQTLHQNQSAFQKYSIIPRYLKDVSKLDTSIELFGKEYPTPLLAAPVGVLQMISPEGELAVARALKDLNIPYIQSTVSSYSIEEIASAAPDSSKWFQLYWAPCDPEISYSMVKRAEQAGYEAIVLTIDTMMLGWRETDMRNQFSPISEGYGKGNWATDPAFLKSIPNNDLNSIIEGILANLHHPTLQWANIKELKKRTTLPVLIKGILHPEDAKLALENGVDGIIVSNHGGRQLDGVIPSIDALPAIVEAINGQIPVLFDSGIRRGTDVVKALALGANAVLIGRPFVYGLAIAGEEGVKRVFSTILKETEVTLSMAGITEVKHAKELSIVKQ
ncbi:alpha-hydroxy acid oxidase [Rummeliibacillus sp. JY-2-4R]